MGAVSVGFMGGASVFELGSIGDMDLFFTCLDALDASAKFGDGWRAFLIRLYFNYVKLSELDEAVRMMEEAFVLFSKLPSASVAENVSAIASSEGTALPIAASDNLADLFRRYFIAFGKCASSAASNYKAFSSYATYTFQAPRIVRTDMPRMVVEKRRSLIDYDGVAENSLPFWKR